MAETVQPQLASLTAVSTNSSVMSVVYIHYDNIRCFPMCVRREVVIWLAMITMRCAHSTQPLILAASLLSSTEHTAPEPNERGAAAATKSRSS